MLALRDYIVCDLAFCYSITVCCAFLQIKITNNFVVGLPISRKTRRVDSSSTTGPVLAPLSQAVTSLQLLVVGRPSLLAVARRHQFASDAVRRSLFVLANRRLRVAEALLAAILTLVQIAV